VISFGPVPSRRLGKSLGINNIISPKVCSYSCVYCQVGKTAKSALTRQPFFEPGVIMDEVVAHLEKLSHGDKPDYLTFVSNGEPTLDVNLGESIRLLKKMDIPVAVITNSSMLSDRSVHKELMQTDWVSLKVDAADAVTWKKINRPVGGLRFDVLLDGLYSFASEYTGALRTETMLCKGLNDDKDNLSAVAAIIKKLAPGRAYISIPTRPPADKGVMAPDPDRMNIAWQIFSEAGIDTELLTGFEGVDTGHTGNIYDDILNITAVHPLREDSLRELLKRNNADFKIVESLLSQRLIRCSIYQGKKFYLRDFQIK
jgi:wyosine [tRNA(Phe)-imidazoG37] synthetase (radical SAM superfamily)